MRTVNEDDVRAALAGAGKALVRDEDPADPRRPYAIHDERGDPVVENISLKQADRLAACYTPNGKVRVYFGMGGIITDNLAPEMAAKIRATFRWPSPSFAVKEDYSEESWAGAIARTISEHNEGEGIAWDSDAAYDSLVYLGQSAGDEDEQVWALIMYAGWSEDPDADPMFEVHFTLSNREERDAKAAAGAIEEGDGA